MKRSLVSTVVLLGLLNFFSTVSFSHPIAGSNTDPKKKAPPHGDTVFYYNERGKIIWMDVNAPEKMSYVIKTKRTSGHIYGDIGQQSAGYCPADVVAISRRDYKKVEKLIKSGNTGNDFVRNNIIRILNRDILRSMRSNIKDDGNGDVHNENNKEYGGYVKSNGMIADTASGAVVDPCTLSGAHIVLTGMGKFEFHSHPSGTRKNGGDDDITQRVTSTGSRTSFPEKTETFHYIQGPSKTDQVSIRTGNWGYVFGMEDKRIYVYNNHGVVAILSFKAFER